MKRRKIKLQQQLKRQMKITDFSRDLKSFQKLSLVSMTFDIILMPHKRTNIEDLSVVNVQRLELYCSFVCQLKFNLDFIEFIWFQFRMKVV